MTTIEYRYAHRPYRAALVGKIVSRLIAGTANAVREWRRARMNRAAFRNLLGQDDWVFKDIGISRADAEWAAGLPLNVNAAEELERARGRYQLGR